MNYLTPVEIERKRTEPTMEIVPVPEESIGELDESCSSLSSHDIQKEAAPKLPYSDRLNRSSLRNLVVGCLLITALSLAVAAYVCFSIWEDSDVVSLAGAVQFFDSPSIPPYRLFDSLLCLSSQAFSPV